MTGVVKRLTFIAGVIPRDSIALSSGPYQLSYAGMLEAVTQRVTWLSEMQSRRVALHSSNSIEWVLLDLACQQLDIVFIPIPTFFTADQVQHCLNQTSIDTLLTDQPRLPVYAENQFTAVAVSKDVDWISPMYAWSGFVEAQSSLPQGTQKITFTSGTTGNPKGVCLSIEHQWLVAQSLADSIGIRCPRHLCLLPLSTLLENIAGVYTPLLCGGTVVIPPDSVRGMSGSSGIDSKALLSCISDVNPHSSILVPQLLTLLVRACLDGWKAPESLAFIAVGGGKVAPQLIEQARDLGLPVYQGYGLSECGSVVALNTPTNDSVESVGQVLPHCEVSIDQDEIVVSGSTHLGYLGEPSTWYPESVYTGDVGKLCNGHLFVEGRKKNTLITSFGRNICPEWVESILMSKPLLSHSVVLGDAKPYLVAVLSAPEAVEDVVIQRWITACNLTLPDYAQIRNWLRVTEKALQPFVTANGRSRRENIENFFAESLDRLYMKNNGKVIQLA